MATQRTTSRVAGLDGLRTICALAVVGYHMRLRWLGGGLMGVTVLFVLSGYLITSNLMGEYSRRRGKIDIGGFYARRAWRLFPTCIVFIAVIGAVCALASPVLFTKMRPDIVPALLMYLNWSKILAHESYFAAAGAPSPLTHFWSLAIEAQFWLVWPPVFYLLMRRGVKRRTVGIGLIVFALASAALMAALFVPGQDPTRPYYGTDTRAQSLLLGAALAIFFPLRAQARRSVRDLRMVGKVFAQGVGVLALAGLIAIMVLTEGYTAFSYYGGILLGSVLTVAVIYSLTIPDSLLSRVLSLPPLAWVGRRSFAIYVWHYPMLELMNPLNDTGAVSYVRLAVELVLIIVVAELSYRLVERPLSGFVPAFGTLGEASERAGQGEGGTRLPHAVAALPAWVPAAAVTGVTLAIMVFGLVTVEPVTVTGSHPGEQVVMQSSLKKPLRDGVYDVVLVGDSVSLGANEQLNAYFPHGLIDTRGERQMPEALEVIEALLDQGVVGDDVVFSIGTNGMIDKESLDRLLADVGEERRLWLVNLRSPNAKDQENNAVLASFADAHDNVHLIDWNAATEGQEGWLIEDGIHLTWDGRDAFAKLVVDTMGYEPPDSLNTAYQVTIMGDTVCLEAADELAQAYPHGLVDTADGRGLPDTLKAFRNYLDSDVVGGTVVLAVGNEERVVETDLDAFVNAVGNDRVLWIVNVRNAKPFEQDNNKVFEHVANTHSNVGIIDWYAESEGNEDYLAEDGAHLTKRGAEAYSTLIRKAIDSGELVPVPLDAREDKEAEEGTEGQESDQGVVAEGTEDAEATAAGDAAVDATAEEGTDEATSTASSDAAAEDSAAQDATGEDYAGTSDSSGESYDYTYDDYSDYTEYEDYGGYDYSQDYTGYDESYDYGYEEYAA